MADPFEYDVFLSFSSADEDIVKPIWQELCSNGLRVFWSNSTLKKEVGNSWFDVIEQSLERSKHMLLVCSESAMKSKWVQAEYKAFYNVCYSPGYRKLIPILTPKFPPNNLPLFLREFQFKKIDDPHFLGQIIPLLGGINIDELRRENESLKERVMNLSNENALLRQEVDDNRKQMRMLRQAQEVEKNKVANHSKELQNYTKGIEWDLEAARREVTKLATENKMLKESADLFSKQKESLENPIDFSKAVVVSNLPKDTNEKELLNLFSKAGTPTKVRIRVYQKSKGLKLATIEMSTTIEAAIAVALFHQKRYFRGFIINVSPLYGARAKENSNRESQAHRPN